MGELTQGDFERTVEFFNDLSARSDVAGFLRHATRGLSRLVDSDITTLSVCDLVAGTRRVFTWPEDAITPADQARFDRYIHQHPLVAFHSRHPESGSRKISDSLAAAAFRRLELYGEYYRPLRIGFVMAVPVVTGSRAIISFVLNREIRDFSEHDRQVLDLVRPTLANLYRNMAALQQARTWIARSRAVSGEPVREPMVVLPLTAREREVLRWVAAGKTNPDVAAIVGASTRTVQKHLEHVFVKLGVETRTAAVARAFGLGGHGADPALNALIPQTAATFGS